MSFFTSDWGVWIITSFILSEAAYWIPNWKLKEEEWLHLKLGIFSTIFLFNGMIILMANAVRYNSVFDNPSVGWIGWLEGFGILVVATILSLGIFYLNSFKVPSNRPWNKRTKKKVRK